MTMRRLQSCKSAETSECAKRIPTHLKAVVRKKESRERQLSHETERRNNEVFDESSTRVFVFKEVSSLDEDDSCNLGRRSSWGSKLGLVKKIKLSEDGTAMVSESFEKFCETHKSIRQNDERPISNESRRVPKPHLQPTVERGLKKQPRPTINKLSDIAVNKYPDSIFKVYIPEGNRFIKKKRVVPLNDMKPVTPARTGAASKGLAEQANPRHDKNPNARIVVHTLKTKHSIPHQTSHTTERRLRKAVQGKIERKASKSGVSGQGPKKMTHITDISLTKEQEKKRMIEREVMRKRTMDVVKMAFPVTGNEEQKGNESGMRLYDSEISGDETSKQKDVPSKSKSSLKSLSSQTTHGQQVAGRRSVTWGENEWSDSPSQRHGDDKQCLRRKKKTVNHLRKMSSSHIARTDLRSNNRLKPLNGSKSNIRSVKGVTSCNKREKNKISRPIVLNESNNPVNENINKSTKKKSTFTRTATAIDSNSDSDRKYESDYEDRCSRGRPPKKHIKNKKPFKRCDCGRVIDKNKTESGSDKGTSSDKNTKQTKNAQSVNQNQSQNETEDSFQAKRNAILRKHSTKELAHPSMDDFGEYSNTLLESETDLKSGFSNEEEMFHMKRGRSTPTLRKRSTMDCSYGSSDSELCFRRDSSLQSDKLTTLSKLSSGEYIDEKPLRKIFDSSNTQNEVTKNELGITVSYAEHIAESKSISESKIVAKKSGSEQNINISESFTEGFKMTKMNMKSRNIEELRKMQDAQLKYFTDEESVSESLMKEECVLNLKTVVHLNSEQTHDNDHKLKMTSDHCKSPSFTGLNKEYVCVDAYSMVTNSSKSLSREQSSSMPLIREVPMLNLSYDDKSVKSDVPETGSKLQLAKRSPKSATDISSERNINAHSYLSSENSNIQNKLGNSVHYQQDHLQDDYSQSFKVKSNVKNSFRPRQQHLRTQKSAGNMYSDLKISSEKERPVLHQQPTNSTSRNVLEKNSSSEKSPSPQSPKSAEDRKLHLQKMLSKGESVGTSRMANQIMEKWNSTQKSISQRKEKMLASLRDTRNVETERFPTHRETKKRTHDDKKTTHLPVVHQVDYQDIQCTEDRLSNEANTHISNVAAVCSGYETLSTEKDEPVFEEDENLSSEKEDFEKTIRIPGSRIPQPYSATNILDPSDRYLDESLSPFTSEDTPEKPLCESPDSGIIALPYDNNLSLCAENEQTCAVSDVEEEIPERDLSVHSPIDSFKTDITSPGAYVNARSSISDVDSTYGSTRSNASNNESSICSHINSVDAIHSDENAVITQSTVISIIPSINVQEAIGLKKSNTLQKSASYSRPISHGRYSTPLSRRSKASSSGSSRRSVESSGRPPSRKPQIMDTTDEESDHEIITSSSPYHVDSYSRYESEPLKKAPTSRMYSTLNHTPHSGQESIKTAIKDLDDVTEDTRSNSYSDRPMSSGHCSSRGGGYQSCSRPNSGKKNIPKMSPGSIKILKEKSRNVPQRSGTPVNASIKENVVESQNTKPSSWNHSTRLQEPKHEPCSSLKDQRSSKVTSKSPTGRNKGNVKPQFRYFSRNKNEDEDMWNLQKLKNFAINKTIENYLPPWERVDLTPPDSALRKRASNEMRLGIKSKVTARTSSPQGNKTFTTYQCDSGSSTPRSCTSPVPATRGGLRTPVPGRGTARTPICPGTPIGGIAPVLGKTPVNLSPQSDVKTPVRCRTPIGEKTPVGCRTPNGEKTPARCRTPIGEKNPVCCRTPIGDKTPVGCRTPNGEKTPARCRTPISDKTAVGYRTPIGDKSGNDCRSPVNSRPMIGNMSPVVRSRTPIRTRTPNPPEQNPEKKPVAERNMFSRTNENHQDVA